MLNNFYLYGISLPAPARDGYLNALCYGIRSVCTRRSGTLPDVTQLLPAGVTAGSQQRQLAKGPNRECRCVLPELCLPQRTDGRTSSTFPLKLPAPGALLVLGE